MAKTILIKDIDGNICYPKTIKNNIYGLVGELNSIKEAIGITDPVDIMVLFKGTSNPPTDSTYSGFDNIKVGDTYLNTTNSKYYILVAINGPEVGVKSYRWQEIIKSDSIDDYISNVLSTDTQVGASLANNTGLISTLAGNYSFANYFLSGAGASEAKTNAFFGSAIAGNQAIFNYWFGSGSWSAAGNLFSWLFSGGVDDFMSSFWSRMGSNNHFKDPIAQGYWASFVVPSENSYFRILFADLFATVAGMKSEMEYHTMAEACISMYNMSYYSQATSHYVHLVDNIIYPQAPYYVPTTTTTLLNANIPAISKYDKIIIDLPYLLNTSGGSCGFRPFDRFYGLYLSVSTPASAPLSTRIVIDTMLSVITAKMWATQSIYSIVSYNMPWGFDVASLFHYSYSLINIHQRPGMSTRLAEVLGRI